jgi:hypothetical protein
MKEIFDLQWKLNIYTLEKIGIDFFSLLENQDLKTAWIEHYRKALSAELAELVREVDSYGTSTQNGRVEVVDMLHFLVSLSQLLEIEPSQIPIPAALPGHIPPFQGCVVRTFLALDELQNSLKWKWWAKGGGFKPEKARRAALDLWTCLGQYCELFAMDFDTLKAIYIEKNQVNFKRQEQDYNEDTKRPDH